MQEPLQPAYELGQAPGMTQQLHLGRTAKDAMQLVEVGAATGNCPAAALPRPQAWNSRQQDAG